MISKVLDDLFFRPERHAIPDHSKSNTKKEKKSLGPGQVIGMRKAIKENDYTSRAPQCANNFGKASEYHANHII